MSGPLVVFVGPPGAGKSTVGRLVAARRGVGFRDTDEDVAAAAGKSVADVFIESGEPEFRALERVAVGTALADHDGVLAVGGGAVGDPDTRDALREAFVVFLDVGAAEAAVRVGFDAPRPLLLVNPRAELRRLLEIRRPFYEAVASVTVATDGRTVDEVAADVLAVLP